MASISLGFRIIINAHRLGPTLYRVITQQIENRYSRRSAKIAARLRSLVAGRKVLILGAGPGLNDISPSQFAELKRRFLVIGVNRTFYVAKLDIFLSSYPSEQCLAGLYPDNAGIRVQMRPATFVPVIAGTEGWQRVDLTPGQQYSELGEGKPSIIRTRLNVILGATDMAVRLGAAEVFYLGVEQNNQAHFYDDDEQLRDQMARQLEQFRRLDPVMSVDHGNATLDLIIQNLRIPYEELAGTPFYEKDHSSSFRLLFEEFSERNVRFVSIGEDTVIARAGAETTTVEEILDR